MFTNDEVVEILTIAAKYAKRTGSREPIKSFLYGKKALIKKQKSLEGWLDKWTDTADSSDVMKFLDKRRGIVIIVSEFGIGVSYCRKSDKFDERIGTAIAAYRSVNQGGTNIPKEILGKKD
jgi:hypothetical protein